MTSPGDKAEGKVLFARVSDETHAWVTSLAEAHPRLSLSSVTEHILTEARRRGWTVSLVGQVSEPK